MEFSTGDNGGTAESPSETVIHWISDRPTSKVVCEERTPPKTNVVTRVGFRHSLYELYNADMPLFGSGSGGAASATGASAKSEDETSRGARLKEDAGEDATTGNSPRNIDNTSRESSPQRSSPDNTHKRDRYALLFGIQLTDVDRAGSHMLPHYAWIEMVIKDILGADIQEISDVIVLSPVECMVYSGQRLRGQGFNQAEVTEIARQIHDSHTMWIGLRMQMHCVPRTVRDARLGLKSAKEYIRECTYGKLGTRSPMRRSGDKEAHRQAVLPWDTSRGRGMVRHSDKYLADQYPRRERREGRAHAAWPEESDPQDATTAWVRHYAEAPEARIGTGAGLDRRRAGVGHGYPLGRGRPEDIPQSVTDAFHSAQEDQWNSPPESLPDDSDEESDDIVAYDTTTSQYTTRNEQDRRERRDNHLAYRRCHRERRHGPNGCTKKLNLPIFRDSSSDNAITYDDWRSEVDNYVREGHSHQLIRDSVLSTLEGRPRHTAKAAMVDGDGSLKSIMSALDQVYGGATTYTMLLNKLNSVQQGYAEPAKDYYERVLQIRVKLQEFHAYMFRRGDLECQTKEAFFNGLKPEYQVTVVHKKDDPTVGTTDLLSAVRKCEENQENNRRNRQADYAKRYPPSTSRPAIEITTAIMSEFRHQRLQVQTDTDMIIATQIGTCPCVLHKWSPNMSTTIGSKATTYPSMQITIRASTRTMST